MILFHAMRQERIGVILTLEGQAFSSIFRTIPVQRHGAVGASRVQRRERTSGATLAWVLATKVCSAIEFTHHVGPVRLGTVLHNNSFMEFCDECGSMMHTDGDRWVCRACDYEIPRGSTEAEEATMTTTQGQEEGGVVDMSEVDDAEIGPTTEAICPNPDCDSDRARYQMKQLRSADESETRFFTCVKCGKNWREDDH